MHMRDMYRKESPVEVSESNDYVEKFRGEFDKATVYASSLKRRSTGSSNYPYAVTRIRAMKVKLIPRDSYPRLLNMSLDEFIFNISETDYRSDIEELSREYSGANLIEHALNRNMATSFQKVLRITEGDPHDLVQEYLKKYDIWNIKTILRGKLHNISPADIREALITAGSLRYTLLSSLSEKSLDEILKEFKETEYAPILDSFDGSNLPEIENKLDKFYYTNLFSVIGYPFTSDRKLFNRFVQREIDGRNLNLLIRLKKAESFISEEKLAEKAEKSESESQISDINDLLIENGFEFNINVLQDLYKSSYEQFVEVLKSSSYWNVLRNLVENKDFSTIDLTDIENALLQFNLKEVTSESLQSIVSIVPIMEYLIYKSNEVRNLRIIARGKSVGMSNELIKEQLVII